MVALLLKTFKYQQKETFMTLSSIILTILAIICFGFTLLHYLYIKQDRRTVEDIKRLHDRCAENSKAYLRLEARITTLEKGNQS
jgi:hypothetical protein